MAASRSRPEDLDLGTDRHKGEEPGSERWRNLDAAIGLGKAIGGPGVAVQGVASVEVPDVVDRYGIARPVRKLAPHDLEGELLIYVIDAGRGCGPGYTGVGQGVKDLPAPVIDRHRFRKLLPHHDEPAVPRTGLS